MMPGVRAEARGLWIACLTAGLLVLLGCVLPTIEIGQGAFIRAGDTQQSFDYDRSVRLATYLEPGAMLFVLGGAGMVLLTVIALARGSTPVLVARQWCRSRSSSRWCASPTSSIGRTAASTSAARTAGR